ncbi:MULTISPECIES: DNA adenine methylase [unclassified Coleofasciculus]|uniref:DNA adenine methylase n=1 Tax=unclassified Coleofasciculus TaxID=2692782 RepID=UPI0018826432|nr:MULTISPECIES: DNA adenine methylase [unclassified Coleofasciculus]MBE9127504.1 DNA adenine methylase [Coleofasciculus sp. LEGE 07081]MBE9150834.1 DNA adenine methylase [Coleofasciculus sp. LEGE 07092]
MTRVTSNSRWVKPFLKWAGGKGQLLEQLKQFFPHELASGSIKRYIEPFVGGGAVFLYVAQSYPVDNFFISDINPELILAYKTIQRQVNDLIERLLEIEYKYLSLEETERKDYFYLIRSKFNFQRTGIENQSYNPAWIERTAQLIFLNRTCFNGLFRVNSKGDFNVPAGRYKNPKICDEGNLRAVAKILQRTQIQQGDFRDCEQVVNSSSFVYLDPPYRPISKTANFTAYSQAIFDDSEQLRLRDFFRLLDKQGAKLMLSNSDPKNEKATDDFFENAYDGYLIKRVKATRNINSNSSKRGQIDELLIMNY